ncbi:MAG: sigma-70 family RNA polymerase sigma factor [Thermofilaceae archaeon]
MESKAKAKFFKELDKYPLLSHEEELLIAQKIRQSFIDILNFILNANYAEADRIKEKIKIWQKEDPTFFHKKYYIKEIKTFCNQLPPELKNFKNELSQKIKIFETYINKMVTANLRLVLYTIKTFFSHSNVDIEDLIQEGNLGLIEAVYRYNYDKQNKFSSYALFWIKQTIRRSLQTKYNIIHYSTYMLELRKKVFQAYEELEKKLNRTPTLSELAQHLDLPLDIVVALFESNNEIVYLDMPVNNTEGDDDLFLKDIIADEKIPQEEVEKRLFFESLKKNFSFVLDEREEAILRMTSGLNESDKKTLEEIASKFKISRERVRQLRIRAEKKVKKYI